MYIVYKDIGNWINKDPNLKTRFNHLLKFLEEAIREYSVALNKTVENKTGNSIEIKYSTQLIKQALIDAFDDLLRLKNYHPTDTPNPIKEMSYIIYWFVKRKPVMLMSEKIVDNKSLSDLTKNELLFINESFSVRLLMQATFPKKEKTGFCQHHIEDYADKQCKCFSQFLLYYLVYRVSSPKEIEAILIGCTMHPIWNVNPIIWDVLQADINKEF